MFVTSFCNCFGCIWDKSIFSLFSWYKTVSKYMFISMTHFWIMFIFESSILFLAFVLLTRILLFITEAFLRVVLFTELVSVTWCTVLIISYWIVAFIMKALLFVVLLALGLTSFLPPASVCLVGTFVILRFWPFWVTWFYLSQVSQPLSVTALWWWDLFPVCVLLPGDVFALLLFPQMSLFQNTRGPATPPPPLQPPPCSWRGPGPDHAGGQPHAEPLSPLPTLPSFSCPFSVALLSERLVHVGLHMSACSGCPPPAEILGMCPPIRARVSAPRSREASSFCGLHSKQPVRPGVSPRSAFSPLWLIQFICAKNVSLILNLAIVPSYFFPYTTIFDPGHQL